MTKPIKILISACLLGHPVRYDASHKALPNNTLERLKKHYDLYSIGPECEGGLSTPRLPCEINGGDGRNVWENSGHVIQNNGNNISRALCHGAQKALQIAQRHNISHAILKDKSPSCGVHQIYNGAFCGKLINGMGVTTALLQKHRIKIFDENNIDKFIHPED